jgi:hypothetical protein
MVMTATTVKGKIQSRFEGSRLGAVLGAAVVLAICGVLLSYNLGCWPVTWYDEGRSCQAARNLAELGRYGIMSSDGFRPYTPHISTGPTVIVPIALLFRAAGTGLLQARIVMVGYAVLAVLCLYLLALRFFDAKAAVVASLLFISAGAASGDISASFLGLGRMVKGEVPALALLLAGALLWSWSLRRGGWISLVGVGLLWGLSIVTKGQCVFILPGLILTWVVAVLLGRDVRRRWFLVPLVLSLSCAGAWSVWQYWRSGGAQQAEVAGRVGSELFLLVPRLVVKSSRVLLSQREIVWGLPGVAYGLYLAVTSRRSEVALPLVFLISTCLIWLSWFIFGSIGWPRYAFPPIAMMTLLTGKLLVDLLTQSRWPFVSTRADALPDPAQSAAVRSVVVLLAIALMVSGSLQSLVRDIIVTRDNVPSDFAQYLDDSIPVGAVVECFEPEIVFLSRGAFQFHQPSLLVESLAIQHAQLGTPYPDGSYDFRQQGVGYVINGPFSKATQIYEQGLDSALVSLVVSVGPYDLYRVIGEGSRE